MMLAYIKAAGGDYSLACPPIEVFGAMVQEIANQNAYSVEYDISETDTETGGLS